MLVRTAPGVTPKLLPSGRLELSSSSTGERRCCGPIGAAMWIALNQNSGRVDRAADMLAELWGTDPVATRAAMVELAGQLCDAGLLRPDFSACTRDCPGA